MTQNTTTPLDGATTHARTTRRGLMGGLALALGAAPALAAARQGLATADTLADDGPTFLAREAEHEALLKAANACGNDGEGQRVCNRAARLCQQLLTTPCTSRTAAVVKLRAVLHPEVGLFACGESAGDQVAIQQALAVLGDGRGQWAAAAAPHAFWAAHAAWSEAHEAYGEVINRLDIEDVYEGPEIDAAEAREGAAFGVMLAAPTPSRAALADKLDVIASQGAGDRLTLFIAALRRGEG